MLFPTPEFLFGFLPAATLGYFLLAKISHRLAILWLAIASIFFYGYWNTTYLWLLIASICFNYAVGTAIIAYSGSPRARTLLTLGVSTNVCLLIYYKYCMFLASVARSAGLDIPLFEIYLPLGISFFTFTQIAFLVDAYRGQAERSGFVNYFLFVTYFPHLIAGPILHHRAMMSQFATRTLSVFSRENFMIGLTFLLIGLFKKLVIADNIAGYANDLFTVAEKGVVPDIRSAWIGAVAYSFQLYFDFSGYCDMAVGMSRMLNITIPYNFNSPYKATSIIDFWRRWHMTLSNFLRDYLYIPLGGNRRGDARRYVNLFMTMLIGGAWHGAGWTFVVWGALHGSFLVVNHLWVSLRRRLNWTVDHLLYAVPAWLLTMACVVVAWVYFRASTFASANIILKSMLGLTPSTFNVYNDDIAIYLLGLGAIVALLPNTQQLIDRASGYRGIAWRPSVAWGLGVGVLAGAAATVLSAGGGGMKNFLYFQF